MKVKLKKIDTKKLIWSTYAFILIFAPPFMPYPHLALAVFSILLLAIKYKKYYKNVYKNSNIRNWLIGMEIWAVYVCFIPVPISLLVNDVVDISHYITLFNRFAVLICTIIPCAALMLSVATKEKWDYNFVVEIIINAGMIESISCILAFFSSTIKNFFIILSRQFNDGILLENTWYITVRSYGFARTLVDVFGFGMGLIAGICFFYGMIRKKGGYIIYSLIIAMSALINARTGVVLYAIGVILTLGCFILKGHVKDMLNVIVGIVVCIFIMIYFWKIIDSNTETASWIVSGLEGIPEFFESGRTDRGSLGGLFKNNWDLPGGLRTIIGTGHSLYGTGIYRHSDIGYINDIWLGGILGCIFSYGLIVKMAIYIWKNSNLEIFKFMSMYSLFCFFAFNFKGCAIGYNPGATTLFLLLFTMRYFAYSQPNIRGL